MMYFCFSRVDWMVEIEAPLGSSTSDFALMHSEEGRGAVSYESPSGQRYSLVEDFFINYREFPVHSVNKAEQLPIILVGCCAAANGLLLPLSLLVIIYQQNI
jgi:hypothetical protein